MSHLPSHTTRACLITKPSNLCPGMRDTLPSEAAHFTSRMTSRSQQGKTPGSSDHDPQQPSGSQLLACSCPAIPSREASGRLWLGGPQGMPVSQHPPKKQYLPTPLAAWNNSLPPLGGNAWHLSRESKTKQFSPTRRQSASFVATQLAGTKGDAVLFRELGKG